MTALLSEIVQTKYLRLKHLSLTSSFLPSLSSNLLSEAVIRLESIEASKLSDDQIQDILRHIVEAEHLKLRKLHCFAWLSVYHLSPQLLAAALVRLESTDIEQSWINNPSYTGSLVTNFYTFRQRVC